ncbi:MAG: UPF0175 family protein [Phycisphaerales bacterium]
MILHLRDDILREAGVSEQDAVIELACRLFDAGKLALWPAAQLAGLARTDFEYELRRRGLAVYRYTPEMLEQELEAIRKIWGPPC